MLRNVAGLNVREQSFQKQCFMRCFLRGTGEKEHFYSVLERFVHVGCWGGVEKSWYMRAKVISRKVF